MTITSKSPQRELIEMQSTFPLYLEIEFTIHNLVDYSSNSSLMLKVDYPDQSHQLFPLSPNDIRPDLPYIQRGRTILAIMLSSAVISASTPHWTDKIELSVSFVRVFAQDNNLNNTRTTTSTSFVSVSEPTTLSVFPKSIGQKLPQPKKV